MSTLYLSGFMRTYVSRHYELAMLASEIIWGALHLTSLLLAGLGMFWSFQMIGVLSDPLMGLQLFVLLSALALYLAAAIAVRTRHLLGYRGHGY